MKYTIDFMEKKTINVGGTPKQLIEGAFKDEQGITVEATIWRDGKDGSVFPNFDTLMAGHSIVANAWTNPKTGKIALYPLKETSRGSFGASRGVSASKGLDKKIAAIDTFQDKKETSIKLSGAMRDAVQLAICELEGEPDKSALASRILHWRNWILGNLGDERDTKSPF